MEFKLVSRGFPLVPPNKESCLLAGGEPHVHAAWPLKSNHNNKVSKISNHHLQRSKWGRNKSLRGPLLSAFSLHILTRFITRIKKWPCDVPADACGLFIISCLTCTSKVARPASGQIGQNNEVCTAQEAHTQRTPTIVHKSCWVI